MLHAIRDPGQRHVVVANTLDDLGDFRGVAQIKLTDEPGLYLLLQLLNQILYVCNMLLYTRLHQRLVGCDEQMHDRLLGTAKTGAVATGERQVVILVEQNGL